MLRFVSISLLALALPAFGTAPAPKEPPREWPMFGGTPARNMVNPREKLPALPGKGPDWEDKDAVKKWEAEWVLWKADVGSRAHAGPVVTGGKVFVGTNNKRPRNPRDMRVNGNEPPDPLDRGIMMVFDEKTGKFLWQSVQDPPPARGVGNWPWEGQTSTPTVVGDRVYFVTVYGAVVCADVNGFANGNQGVQNEKYKTATDADVIWEYHMVRELNVYPHCASNCSPLVVGDRIYVCTGNGVDESHVRVPEPDAPSLICLDRHTGKLLWKDASPGKDIMHGQWSSPTYAAEPVPQVIHGQGDGWLRAFDPATGKLLWKFDCNPKNAKFDINGTGDKSDFLATPVVHNGRVYIGTGQDPEHSTGIAHLWCIDLKKATELGAKAEDRDVSPELVVRFEKQDDKEKVVTRPNPFSALAWVYGGEEPRKWAARDFKFGRTMSTVAVVDDILYATELHGSVHCLNAKTGEHYWQYDTKASIWNSPYYVDGKVLVGNDAGELYVFKHMAKPVKFDDAEAAKDAPDAKTARAIRKAERAKVEQEYVLARIEFPNAIRATPTVVNGVLYVPIEYTLYAIGRK